MDNPSRFFE
ncbi:hypothetical protein F383_02396 [Gossypium arboreum]|uniref:Uncharacterized protein n=1 Tax=Gossypium arboreum TaxID=29729 RepID=A0A0B0N5Z8_GOSAR|nr:hypothetical protein F383_02396 [Gossypium arboreum]